MYRTVAAPSFSSRVRLPRIPVDCQWSDTHAHLFQDCFQEDETDVLARCAAQRITRICLPNIDLNTVDAMLRMQEKYPNLCFPALGLHPCYVDGTVEYALQALERQLGKRPFLAIGETGLDFYRSTDYKKEQLYAFKRHLLWARHYDLPIIIHCRHAFEETLSVLQEMKHERPKTGIFHCFTGDVSVAQRIISMGYCLGIGGIISYERNRPLRSLLTPSLLPHIVLETDSPYLAPSGVDVRRNEPSFLPLIGKQVAKCMGLPIEEVARITTQNAARVFKDWNL